MAWAKLLGYDEALSLLKANEQEENPNVRRAVPKPITIAKNA
jgi:ferritin-like metal-binding protein YciE